MGGKKITITGPPVPIRKYSDSKKSKKDEEEIIPVAPKEETKSLAITKIIKKGNKIIEKKVCRKCNTELEVTKNFYKLRSGERTDFCKKCMTLHVNPFDENTFLWLFEKMDIPYSKLEWAKVRNSIYQKDPKKFSGALVFGRYLSKMYLSQWIDKRWKDTEAVQKEEQGKIDQLEQSNEELTEMFEKGEISEAEYKALYTNEEDKKAAIAAYEGSISIDPNLTPIDMMGGYFDENQFMKEEDLPNPGAELTQEDKIYLATKWGRLYKPDEWVELEKKYEEMTQSFKIEDSDTRSSLILICKTYLKMNQAIKVDRSPLNLVNLIRGVAKCG